MMLRLVRDDDDEKDFMRLLLFSPPVVLPLSPFDEFDLPPLPVEPPDPFALFKIMAMMFWRGRRLESTALNFDLDDEGMF